MATATKSVFENKKNQTGTVMTWGGGESPMIQLYLPAVDLNDIDDY